MDDDFDAMEDPDLPPADLRPRWRRTSFLVALALWIGWCVLMGFLVF